MTRTRLIAAAAVLVALVPLLVLPVPARADGDGLTRLRLTITTDSDWTTVHLSGTRIRAQHVTSTTPGARAYERTGEWTVVPVDDAAAELVTDLVVDLAPGDEPRLVVRKGREGVTAVQLAVRNGPRPVTAAHVVLDSQDPDANVIHRPIDRGALDPGGLDVPTVDDRRLSLAFYYPWFDAGASGDRRISPDKPVAPFATSDAASVAAMVDQARGAGLDGFVVAWEGDLHAGPVGHLLDAVRERPGFTVTPLIELRAMSRRTMLLGAQFDPAAAARATRDFLDRIPAGSRLDVDGRPVVMAFGVWDLTPGEWAAYRAHLADLDPFIVGDRAEATHPVEGYYEYDPNPWTPEQLGARADRAVDRTRIEPLVDPTTPKRLWAATASPGFDNRASKPLWQHRTRSRESGWRYDVTWEVALRSEPDWMLVTSWNEWYEQTHIAPGSGTGTMALEQTARWTARFAASVTAGS